MARPPQDLSGIAFGPDAAALPLSDRRNRVMWLNNDRVFYAGLLGAVSVRTMGGWLVYASLGAPLRIWHHDDAGITSILKCQVPG